MKCDTCKKFCVKSGCGSSNYIIKNFIYDSWMVAFCWKYDQDEKVEPPKIEDIITPKPDVPASVTGCKCDLAKPAVWPPFTDDQVKAMGNGAICPNINGMDIRLACRRPDGRLWYLGQLLPLAVTTGNGNFTAHCFSKDGNYHLLGWTYRAEGDQLQSAAGVIPYNGARTFIVYEYRA
jgi:hypothetical protein